MAYSGFALNSKHTDPWIHAIGKFMINFGSIELLSFIWVDRLSKDLILHDIALDMQLSKRIDLIRKLVERSSLSKNLNKQVREVWAEAESLAKLRNDIAHSPIVFGWHGPEEDRPPDFIGSFNAKKLKSKKQPC